MFKGKDRRIMEHKYPIKDEIDYLKRKITKDIPKLITDALEQQNQKTDLVIKPLVDDVELLNKKVLLGNGGEPLITVVSKHTAAIIGIQASLSENKKDHITMLASISDLSNRFIPVEEYVQTKKKIAIKVWSAVIAGGILGLGAMFYGIHVILEALKHIGG